MRQSILIVIVLLVIGTAWMLYLQHSENKFQATLPKAPVPTSEPDTQAIETAEDVEAPITSEVLEPDAPAERSTPDAEAETAELSDIEAYTKKLYEGLESELIEEPLDLTADDTTDVDMKPWKKPISEMSLAEIEAEVDRRRQALINQFGNTPEVALINKYTTVETLRDRKTTLDAEDSVAYIRAIGVLWPTSQNIQIYKEFAETERNGWHMNTQGLQGVPGFIE